MNNRKVVNGITSAKNRYDRDSSSARVMNHTSLLSVVLFFVVGTMPASTVDVTNESSTSSTISRNDQLLEEKNK